MKMKLETRFAAALCGAALAVALITGGCGTPSQNLATANYLAGNSYATYELGKSADNLPGLEHLAKALPLMVTGQVTAFEMGQLNAELHRAQAGAPAGSDIKNQIGSLISAVAQVNAAASPNPTIKTAVAAATAQDIANGIQHGIDFWKGQAAGRSKPPGS